VPLLDATVRRRFAELAEKAERLAALSERADSGAGTIPAAPFYAWVTNVQNLLARTFAQESLHYRTFVRLANRFTSYESEFASCRAVFLAAREDYEGGYLFNVRAAAKAEVLADLLAQAKALLAAGAREPACVLAQVALEVTLKELAGERGIRLGRLASMNAALAHAGVKGTSIPIRHAATGSYSQIRPPRTSIRRTLGTSRTNSRSATPAGVRS